jgi:hypothetical protein
MRWLTLIILGGVGMSAADYHFKVGEIRRYLAETRQEVAWESAGDHLTFTSSLATSQAWKCVAENHGIATVEVTILRVIAKNQGPGADHRFDSAQNSSSAASADPLLGHLKALDGVTLTMRIDQHSGETQVSGGQRIAEAIAKRAPNLIDPTAPSPLAAQAAQAYSDANLSRIWSQTLALPAATPQAVPLGEPLTGSLTRTWKGLAYTLAGEVVGEALLAKEPTAVRSAMSAVAGEGSLALTADQWPAKANGTLRFTLTMSALTQPVTQQHTVTWQLAQLPASQ